MPDPRFGFCFLLSEVYRAMAVPRAGLLYGEHTDYDGLTFLWRNRDNGLQARLLHSLWSRNAEARLSLVESFPRDAFASSLMP